jgi:hypothetical protein
LNELLERIEQVKRRIALKGLRLNPCLSENEIASFEKRYDVQLPLECRTFLMLVDNGGDGPPRYGLMKLGEVPNDFRRPASDVSINLSP